MPLGRLYCLNCSMKFPSMSSTCSRLLPRSPTTRRPRESMSSACGVLNSPGPAPQCPMDARKLPSLSNFTMARDRVRCGVGVLTAMPVSHEDVAVFGGDDVAWEGEQPIGPVALDAQLTERQQYLTLRTELDDHVALARRVGIVLSRALPVGHPDVAVAVHVEPVRKQEQPAADGRHDVAIRVELQNRVEIRPGAGVAPAPVDGPQAPVLVDVDPGRRPPLSVVRELAPPVDAAIRVG